MAAGGGGGGCKMLFFFFCIFCILRGQCLFCISCIFFLHPSCLQFSLLWQSMDMCVTCTSHFHRGAEGANAIICIFLHRVFAVSICIPPTQVLRQSNLSVYCRGQKTDPAGAHVNPPPPPSVSDLRGTLRLKCPPAITSGRGRGAWGERPWGCTGKGGGGGEANRLYMGCMRPVRVRAPQAAHQPAQGAS